MGAEGTQYSENTVVWQANANVCFVIEEATVLDYTTHMWYILIYTHTPTH